MFVSTFPLVMTMACAESRNVSVLWNCNPEWSAVPPPDAEVWALHEIGINLKNKSPLTESE